jgi:hypothetical protein
LEILRNEKRVTAVLKPLNDEYLPRADEPSITVDIKNCTNSFFLQLSEEECPRLLYLSNNVSTAVVDPRSSQYTTRNTLRLRKDDNTSQFTSEAAQVESIEKQQAKLDRKKKKKEKDKLVARERRESEKAARALAAEQRKVEARAKAVKEREDKVKAAELALANTAPPAPTQQQELQHVRPHPTSKTIELGQAIPQENRPRSIDEKFELLERAEAAEQNRHERELESIRHDEQKRCFQAHWQTLLDNNLH